MNLEIPEEHDDERRMPDYYKFEAVQISDYLWKVTFYFPDHDQFRTVSATGVSWPVAWAQALRDAKELYDAEA